MGGAALRSGMSALGVQSITNNRTIVRCANELREMLRLPDTSLRDDGPPEPQQPGSGPSSRPAPAGAPRARRREGARARQPIRWAGPSDEAPPVEPPSASEAEREGLAILRRHAEPDSCWVLVHGRVLDVTSYLGHHPGGASTLLRYAGADASAAFDATGHSHAAVLKCADYSVGRLGDVARLRRASDAAAAHRARLREIAKYLDD